MWKIIGIFKQSKPTLVMRITLLFSLSFVIVSFSTVNAQTSFGIKAGGNYSTIRTDSSTFRDSKWRTNFHAGIYVNFPVNDEISVQTEFLFNSLGVQKNYYYEEFDTVSIYAEGDYSRVILNYVSVPILVKYSFGPMSIHAGPQFNILGRALQKSETYTLNNSLYLTDSKTRDIQHHYRLIDLSFSAGLGLDFDVFNVALRYSLGLTNIALRGEPMKNSVIQLSCGFRMSEGY
jgi:hypothetical protein